AFDQSRKLRRDQLDGMADRFVVTAYAGDFIDLTPGNSGCSPVRHLELAAERVLIAQTRKVRVEIDKLLVSAFDAASGLSKKFRESRNGIVRADDADADNVAGTRLQWPMLAQALTGIAMLSA